MTVLFTQFIYYYQDNIYLLDSQVYLILRLGLSKALRQTYPNVVITS